MSKIVIGVMWPGSSATEQDLRNSYEFGKYSASKDYATLTGWRKDWVMNEALRWAKENGGLTIGILPDDNPLNISEYLDIPIYTNMRSGRNYLNVLSSTIVVVCGMDSWTSTEISLAIKAGKKVILVALYEEANIFYSKLDPSNVFIAQNYIQGIEILEKELAILKNL